MANSAALKYDKWSSDFVKKWIVLLNNSKTVCTSVGSTVFLLACQSLPLFDVELYLVHKSFASTSLNIIYRTWLHVSSQLSLFDNYLIIIRKYNELNPCGRAQINVQ
jgi:hypothetical protein